MTVKHFYRLSKKQNFARAVGMERRWGVTAKLLSLRTVPSVPRVWSK